MRVARGAGLAAGLYYGASLVALVLSGHFGPQMVPFAVPLIGAVLALWSPLVGAAALFVGATLLSGDVAATSPAFVLFVVPASAGAVLLVLADIVDDVGTRLRSLGAAG